MKKLQIWFLCTILLLTGCGSEGSSTDQPPTEVAESSLDTPEATMNFYIASCESGDTVSAKRAVGHNFKFCEFPLDAISSEQSGDFEINGKTARVVWQWTLPSEASEKRMFTLGSGNKGWYIIEENPLEKIWFLEETEEIDFEEQEQEDEELTDQIVYVLQEGVEGEKVVTEKLTKTWSDGRGTTESEVVSEEIITEAIPRILVVGKKPEADIITELTGLLEQYFASLRNGQYADLLELAPEAANFDVENVSQIAEFEIISFEVRPPNEIRAIKPTDDYSKLGDLARSSRVDVANASLELVLEPFLMEAQLQVAVKYKLFGMELNFNDRLRLRADPSDKVWTMPFWGITEASKINAPSVTLKDNTITLDGVAMTTDSMVVVLTASSRGQILATYEGNSEYAKCIQFPRCSVWLSPPPQSDTFPLIIESGLLGYGSESHEFNIDLTR